LATTVLNSITAPTASLSLNSQKITNLATPTLNTDAATKAYVDSNAGITQANADLRYYLNTVTLNNISAPTSSLSLNSQKITGLADATLATDALNRQTGDSRYYLGTTTLNNITLANGTVSVNTNKISNCVDPVSAQDVATKAYVDAQVSGALVGSITMWPTTTAPTGYFLCDGSAYNTTTYAALFAVLGTGTLPDLRGKFVRGYDPTNVSDPDTRAILSV